MSLSFAATRHHIHSQLASAHSGLVSGDASCTAARLLRLVPSVELFETSPSELDAGLAGYVAQIAQIYLYSKETLASPDVLAAASDLAYSLAKVRGYKVMSNHFASDVYLLPRISQLLAVPCTDHERYFLMLWMCRLVLLPFPLDSISAGLADKLDAVGELALDAGAPAGLVQHIALVFLCNLLLRPDCREIQNRYLQGVFENWIYEPEARKLSHLMVLNKMLKKSLVSSNPQAADHLKDLLVLEAAKIRFDSSYELNSTTLVYLVKLMAKTTSVFVARQDYSVVAHLINVLVHFLDMDTSTRLRECIAKSLAKITQNLNENAQNYALQVVEYISKGLHRNDPAPSVPQATTHASDATVALKTKGPGSSLASRFSMSRYHIVLLYLGFLSLSRTLPPLSVGELLWVLTETLYFSRQRYAFIPTVQIRDSSCFCAWAVFRQFLTSALLALHRQPLQRLFYVLMEVAIFDDDYVIRRCAVSCLQEFVGRHGAAFFEAMRIQRAGDQGPVFDVTIRLVELLSFSAVSSLAGLHLLLGPLMALGFPKDAFLAPLVDEILLDTPFEVKKLAAAHLGKLLAETSPSAYQATPAHDACSAKRVLVDSRQLYALAEIRPFLGALEIAHVDAHVLSLEFTLHGPQASADGESIMHWLNASLHPAAAHVHRHFALALSISRLSWNAALGREFGRFLRSRPIDDRTFGDICTEITQSGNEILCSAVWGAALSDAQRTTVFLLVQNPRIEAENRSRMLQSFPYASAESGVRHTFHATLLALLDDYTLSVRGDVGLHVRAAAMTSLEQCLEFLDAGHTRTALLKLLRISAEPMDRLRVQAHGLVCSIAGTSSLVPPNPTYDEYFGELFRQFGAMELDADHHLQEAFWEGMVHCAGAITGLNSLINDSFRQLAKYLGARPEAAACVVGLIKVPGKFTLLPQRRQKTVLHALNFLARLWDSGHQPQCELETLYVRLYNLHINTSNVTRISLVIRLLLRLASASAVCPKLKSKARQRLLWLHERHSLELVRLLALQAMFEIINEAVPEDVGLRMTQGVTQDLKEIYLNI